MNTKFTFFMQGSAEEPYQLVLNLDPPSISCTCQAAVSGLPCKHRLHVMQGRTYDLIGLNPETEQAIAAFSEILKKSEIPEYLGKYENAKNNVKATNDKSEKIFKKYRAAVIACGLGKGTKKAMEKAGVELADVIQDCGVVAVEKENIVQTLRTVFVWPWSDSPDTEEMAAEVLESEN